MYKIVYNKYMLQAYRRHLKTCPHQAKGQGFSLCACPIWAYGDLNGIQFRKSLHTTDAEKANRRIDAIQNGTEYVGNDGPVCTVAIATKNYLQACRDRNVKESTIDDYRRTLAHLTEGPRRNLTMGAIDVSFLDTYRQTRTIKPSTWRKELETLRTFFKWAMKRRLIKENPASELDRPQEEHLVTQPFTNEEVSKLLEATRQIAGGNPSATGYIRARAKALALVLLYSGLRISDVAKLRRAALDPETGHLTLRVIKTGVPIKILLHKSAVDALQNLPSSNPEYFFWSGNGVLKSCIRALTSTISRLGKKAVVRAHPHRFRDTFAVELLTQGADIRTVSKLLGHESIRTTEKHYAHFVAAHQALLRQRRGHA